MRDEWNDILFGHSNAAEIGRMIVTRIQDLNFSAVVERF